MTNDQRVFKVLNIQFPFFDNDFCAMKLLGEPIQFDFIKGTIEPAKTCLI